MSQIKQLVKEINNGKNLESNILSYKDILFDIYNQASFLHITMDYFVLYETMQENGGEENGYLKEAVAVINEVVKETFCGNTLDEEKRQELIQRLLETRDDVIRKMKILTMYTDKLQIYEHVINRIELKYEKQIATADVDTFVQKVYQYIFSGKDNVVINENIKEVLAELPVRMARSKYFQLIENSMSVYKDSDKSAVERYVYMLETSAMLYEPEGVDKYFLDVKKFADNLAGLEYSSMSEEQFKEVYSQLEEMAEYISDIADLYVGIQGILNNLYCYLASYSSQEFTDASDIACLTIVKKVQEMFAQGDWPEIAQETMDEFVKIEGKQETLVEDMLKLESVLMDLQISHSEEIEKLGVEEDFHKLDGIQQLIAASGTFVEFDEEKEEEVADEAYILEETQKLLEKLKVQFAENEMCVNRAVIAATISKFPVFFTSSKEVEEYIRESLERCQDDAERQASMNVIQAIMEERGGYIEG